MRIRSLTLLGYTDDIGPAAFNKGLSQERAESVGDFLQAQFLRMGYRVIDIHEHGMGVSMSALNRALDRTVIIS